MKLDPLKLASRNLQSEPGIIFEAVSADGIFETAAGVAATGGDKFVALKTNEEVYAYAPLYGHKQFEGVDIDIPYDARPILVAVHDACLQIAKRVIRQRAQNSDFKYPHHVVTSMRLLWEVLESRCNATSDQSHRGYKARIEAPHNYYMPTYLAVYNWSEVEAEEDEVEVTLLLRESILCTR